MTDKTIEIASRNDFAAGCFRNRFKQAHIRSQRFEFLRRQISAPAHLSATDFRAFAGAEAIKGIRVEGPQDVGPAWDEALAADRPVVYEAVTDPEVPPLPPHITLEQAKAMSSALLKGDPNSRRIIRQTLRDKIAELLPGR